MSEWCSLKLQLRLDFSARDAIRNLNHTEQLEVIMVVGWHICFSALEVYMHKAHLVWAQPSLS